MAGKVAKYGSTISMSFGTGSNNSDYHDDVRSSSGNGKSSNSRGGKIMEDFLMIDEGSIIQSLEVEEERGRALRYLEAQLRENNSQLIFQNKLSLFRGLAETLCDSNINIRIDCTKLIAKIIPQLLSDRERCMNYVIPNMVANIGNCLALQKESVQTLHICMKHSADVYPILKVIAEQGIKHKDDKTRKQIIHTFPTLLFPEFKNEDFFEIVIALVQNLNENESDSSKVMKTLSQVKKFVGTARFSSYINDLPSPLQSLYNEMTMIMDTSTLSSNRSTPSILNTESYPNGEVTHPSLLSFNKPESIDYSSKNMTDFGKSGYFDSSSMKNSLGKGYKVRPNYLTPARSPEMLQQISLHYEFGFIAKSVIENLSSTDNKTRYQAVEDLKVTLENLRDTTPLRKHMIPVISLMQPVIEDNNYRVSCSALQTLSVIVAKLGHDIRPYAKLIATAASRRIGSKDVIRGECVRVLINLQNVTDSATVLDHFWSKLQHKQAKIREETINLVIASLLTWKHKRSDAEMEKICAMLAPMLIDPKPKVRHATIECISVIADLCGPNSKILTSAIDQLEINHDDATGVMSAVQARLIRKKLPKLKDNMLIEYAISPTSFGQLSSPQAADINWIHVPPSGSSSQSSLSHISSSINSSFNSSMDLIDNGQDGLNGDQRRHPSAGKRGVFPWVRELDSQERHSNSAPVQTQRNNLGETHPPVRPRNTWGPESQDKITPSLAGLPQQPQPRTRRVNEPSSSASGGYLEIHQRKQANAINKEPLTNVGTPVRHRKQLEGESVGLHSAPQMGRNMSLSGGGGYQPSFGANDVSARNSRTNLTSVKPQNDVLSNSCPTTFFDENNQVKRFQQSPRRSPLASMSNEPSSGQRSVNDGIINEPESPIHLKPQLARLSAKRRGSPNGNKLENQLNVQTPLKLKNSASPRLDRIADNPTVQNVRPLIKQNRNHTDAKLNNSYSDLLDSSLSNGGIPHTSGYTPSGLQQSNPGLNSTVPMAVIRHPAHQMKATSGNTSSVRNPPSSFNFSADLTNDANNNDLSRNSKKDYVPSKYTLDNYAQGSDSNSSSQLKLRSKSDSHAPVKNSQSLPYEPFSHSEVITHPRLLQKTSSPIQSETPRTAPHAGVRDEDIPASSMDRIRQSAQKKRNQMQRSLSSGKELNTMGMSGLDGSYLSGQPSGRSTAPETGSSNSSILSPISNKTNSHSSSPIQSTSRDSLENIFINGFQSTQNSGRIDVDASPIMTKASIARPGSGKSNGSSPSLNNVSASSSRENTTTDAPPFKYNPNSGVSFSSKKKSDLPVVGQKYILRSPSSSEATMIASSPSATPTNSNMSLAMSPSLSVLSSKPSNTSLGSNQGSRERRRSQRGTTDPDEDFNVTGRAIRDTSSTNLSEVPDYSPTPSKDSLQWSNSNDSLHQYPPDAVYGKAVQQPITSSDVTHEESKQRESVPLSASLLAKQFSKKEDLEKFQKTKKGKSRNRGSNEDLLASDFSHGTNNESKSSPTNLSTSNLQQPLKSKLRKTRSPTSTKVSPPKKSGSRESSSSRTTTDVLPCSNPETMLNEAITKMQTATSEDWEGIYNHIHTLRRLANFHQDVLGSRMHEVFVVLCTNVANLRSQVSRAAVVCLTDIYVHLRKPVIDTDIELTTKSLVLCHGRNTGAFMQEEILKAFQYLVGNCTAVKVLNALLTAGGSNRNNSVRDLVSQFVSLLVERIKPGKALSGVKDITDRILPATASFISDPSQATRYHGRCILQELMTHPDFDKCVDKYLNQKQAQDVKDAVQNIKTRGIGSIGSAGTRNQGSGVRRNGSTRGLSRTVGSSVTAERLPQISSNSRRGTPAKSIFNDQDQEEIRVMCKKLTEGDVPARKEGLRELEEKVVKNRPLVEENIVKIMDGLRSLLVTSNSKLNALGLETLLKIIPDLGNQLPPSDLVPSVCRLLVSKHQNTARLALKSVNQMLEHIDHMQLLQQFATCAMYSPGKTKQVCIEKLAELVTTVSVKKPQAVERHVLPVLLSLMSEKHAMSLKRETTILAKALHEVMGDNLLQYAEAKNAKTKVIEMLES
ncbi:TOG array regulator of axonemal microtubules protein 1-like isoform X2 [Styela clava]